jgi:hypothetical protein
MLRRVGYRQAAVAFVFTSLWFVLGFLLLLSPVPRALGIHSALLAMWILLFFGLLAVSGAALIMASLNGAFPPAERRRRYANAAAAAQSGARSPGSARAKQQQGG